MKIVIIEGCNDCPHHKVPRSHEGRLSGEDSFFITCDHPERKTDEVRSVRIRSKEGRIFFACPLEDLDDYEKREDWN